MNLAFHAEGCFGYAMTIPQVESRINRRKTGRILFLSRGFRASKSVANVDLNSVGGDLRLVGMLYR